MLKHALAWCPSALLLVGLAHCSFAGHTPFAQSAARKMTRIVWFADQGGAPTGRGVSEVVFQYGSPSWQGRYAQQFDQLMRGRRWRFGQDFWTALDTNVQLTIGRKKVKQGIYYVALECDKQGRFFLVLLDPQKQRKKRLDALGAAGTKGGTLLPLEAKQGPVTKQLSIELRPVANKSEQFAVEIKFGPHVLTTTIQAKL